MDPDALTTARQQLVEAMTGFVPTNPTLLDISPWVAMSALQKAIRRGDNQLAQCAAATLIAVSPERLWRRCGGIVFEDVGVADLETVTLVTAALGGKRFRATLGGEWRVASFIVTQMVKAVKCRAADDLLLAAQFHPGYQEVRQDFPPMSTAELTAIATSALPLPIRALATWYGTGIYRPGPQLRYRKGNPKAVFNSLREAGVPFTEIAQEGYRKVGEVLCPFVALLCPLKKQATSTIEIDPYPPEIKVRNVPGWVYDIYTREGRNVYQAFVQGDTPTAQWIRQYVPQRQRISFLGTVIFRIEGGLVDQRLRWSIGDELRRLVDFECNGPHCLDATEILSLAYADIGKLNEVRGHVL